MCGDTVEIIMKAVLDQGLDNSAASGTLTALDVYSTYTDNRGETATELKLKRRIR